jgi:acyl carrier protein
LDDKDIYAKLTPVFQDMFDDEALVLRPEMTADDVEGWDSLSHIRLVLAVSKLFGMKFSAADVGKLKNVGEFVVLIKARSPA